jgi:uncharacterized iron-regulated protein
MAKYDTLIKRLDGTEVHGASMSELLNTGDGAIVKVGDEEVHCKVASHLTTPSSQVTSGFDGVVVLEELSRR